MDNWIEMREFSRTERFNKKSKIKYGDKKLKEFSDEELDDLDNRLAKFTEDKKLSWELAGLSILLGYGVIKSISWMMNLTATKSYQKGNIDLIRGEIKEIQRDRQKLKREIK